MKEIIFCVVAFIIALGVVVAQDQQEQTVYGFGFLNVPVEKGDTYNLGWIRLGVKTKVDDQKTMTLEYDVNASALKYANLAWRDSLFGGVGTVVAGKFLNPVAYLYDAPKWLHATRWPLTINNYGIYSTGLSVWYQYQKILFRIAHYNSNSVSLTVGFPELNFFWEKDIGYGFIAQTTGQNKWLNLRVCCTSYQLNGIKNAYFVSNEVKLLDNLYLFTQLDYQDGYETLTGLTWEYAKYCYVKAYYDSITDKASVVVAFAMN